jgi:8-oxo-dGTP pyrophosphatase MutT (NUDIX family)
MSANWVARKLMQRYWRWQRAMTLGVRAIVVDGEGRFLLVRHTYDKAWIFPGGGVEPRETAATALHRELEEEAGIVAAGEATLLGIYANFEAFPGDHIAAFVIREWRQAREMKATFEIAETGFFLPSALPERLNRGVRRRIDEIQGRSPPSPHW